MVNSRAEVKIREVPIPKPGRCELLVKVIIAGTNSKDWKFPAIDDSEYNSGDELSGIVQEVGDQVFEFKVGDRVAGIHATLDPHGAFAEYAILPAHQTFHLPPNISFEEVNNTPGWKVG